MARRTIDKGLLKNIIRHTDAHNKIQEENEMWKQWELKKQTRKRHRSPDTGHNVRGYMRSDMEESSSKNVEYLKWNRLLLEYKENCKDRWGHSGYKELYPEEFEKPDSCTSDVESGGKQSGDKNQLSKTSVVKKKKKKKTTKERARKKRKISSDFSDNDSKTHKPKKRKGYSRNKRTRPEDKISKRRKKRTKH